MLVSSSGLDYIIFDYIFLITSPPPFFQPFHLPSRPLDLNLFNCRLIVIAGTS